jgi:hypothetical protein
VTPPFDEDCVTPSGEFLVVLRQITSALHTLDEENATGENQTRYGKAGAERRGGEDDNVG